MSSGDVEVLYEFHVTPEEETAALRLQLPANFYAYRRKPPCPGCRGCEPDDAAAPSSAAVTSPILTGLLKTPSFVPPPPAAPFGKPAEPAAPTPLFGQLSFQAATATPVFGAKLATPLFGAKAVDVASVFGMKPAAATTFGAKSVDVTPVFGAKPADVTPVFGAKTSEPTPVFGATSTPSFGGKPSEIGPPGVTDTPWSIFSKPQTTTLGFKTAAGKEANGLAALGKEADDATVPFLPCDSSVSFATLSDTASKAGKPIESGTLLLIFSQLSFLTNVITVRST